MMDFNEYQEKSQDTIVHLGSEKDDLLQFTLGLGGEAGEVVESIKKIQRDKNCEPDAADKKYLEKELGDVLWYVSQLATILGLSLEQIAIENTDKLQSRKARGKLQGSGNFR